MATERYRLFLALELPEALRLAIAARIERAAAGAALPRARWVAPVNLHLTLQFLGDQESLRVAEISAGLAPVFARFPQLQLRLEALGAFPRSSRARVLWLGLGAPSALLELQRAASATLAGVLGRAPESDEAAAPGEESAERFHPHVTLARCREPWRRSAVQAAAELFAELLGETFELAHGTLFRSELGSGGARHHALASFALDRGSMAPAMNESAGNEGA